jgi:hypothetical protein
VILLFLGGCASTVQLPPPRSLATPAPRLDNGGAYLFPYTRDYALADWCDGIVAAGAFEKVGKGAATTVAAAAGGSAMGIFSWALRRVAESIGRQAALQRIGGWDAVRAGSEISFDDLDAYAVYLYQFFSAEATYPDALSAAILLYPELEDRYVDAILEAKK